MHDLQAFAEDLLVVAGPPVRVFGITLTTRMIIVKLADGSLWVNSPVSVSFAMLNHIKGLGPVRYLVAPTRMHVWRLKEWHAFFPDAELWAPPQIPNKFKQLPFTGQGAAPCWDVVSSDGRFAIVTNAGASVETLFSVAGNGQLTFISKTSAGAGVTPLDTALTPNNQFLYTLDAAAGEISEFRFDESSQSLVNFGSISVGLTPNSGMNGLQAR